MQLTNGCIIARRGYELYNSDLPTMAPVIIDGSNVIRGSELHVNPYEKLREVIEFFTAANCKVKAVLPWNQLFHNRKVRPELLDHYKYNYIIETPHKKSDRSTCESNDPRDLVAAAYNLDSYSLKHSCIGLETFRQILTLLKISNNNDCYNQREEPKIPLDDLIVVYEAKRLGGCMLSNDHFRDLVLFDASIKRFVSTNRIGFKFQNDKIKLIFNKDVCTLSDCPLYKPVIITSPTNEATQKDPNKQTPENNELTSSLSSSFQPYFPTYPSMLDYVKKNRIPSFKMSQ